jgi:sugar phosphate isomerase/epimerase
MERDFDGTLAQVAAIGYREVEFDSYFGRTPAQVRDALTRNGLGAPSAHTPLPANDEAWARKLDIARAIGHEWVVIPWLDPAVRRTQEDWVRFAARLDTLATAAQRAGLRLAYHNHDFELARTGDSVPLDLLLARTDPKKVDFEMDVYWVTKAGADPLMYLGRHPGRFPLLHLKDATAKPEQRMVDVGSGVIDFARIISAAKPALRHVFAEHDDPADPLATARASYAHLSRLDV